MKNTILGLFAKISQNPIKSEELVEEGEEDRISALPDCLITEILSRLPSTEEAIRTCTLSKRWKHIWTSVTTVTFKYRPTQRPLNPNSWSDFFSFVDKTLTRCHRSKLTKLVLDIPYQPGFESQVNSWIRYATSRHVKELDLRVCVGALLDQSIFTGSCFTDLTIEGCNLSPPGAICWKNLRRLCIEYIQLDEGLIENILSGSPVLETLEIKSCCGYRRIDITSKSVKKLVICGYMIFDNYVVEINAPNIVSLVTKDLSLGTIIIMDVSCLVEANLDLAEGHKKEEQELKGLILKLCHVKELKIGGSWSEVVSGLEAEGCVFPSNVKFVEGSS